MNQIPLTTVIESVVAFVGQKHREEFEKAARSALIGNPQGEILLPTVLGWYDAGARNVVHSLPQLQLPVVGGGAPAANYGAPAQPLQMNTGLQALMNSAGFSQPQQQFQSSGIVPQQVKWNPGNKKYVRSLAECGPNVYLLPSSPNASQAVCGYKFKKAAVSDGDIWCAAPATLIGTVHGRLSCQEHHTRNTYDGGRGKKKETGTPNGVPSGQQIQGLSTVQGLPPAFNQSEAVNGVANFMSQTPGNWAAQTNIPGPMANQVMNGMQSQISNLGQPQQFQPAGQVNFGNMMQQPNPQFSVPPGTNINPQAGFGGQAVQFTPQQPQGQQQQPQQFQQAQFNPQQFAPANQTFNPQQFAPQQQQAQFNPQIPFQQQQQVGSGQPSGSGSEEEDHDEVAPVVDQSKFAAALNFNPAAAQQQQPQQFQVPQQFQPQQPQQPQQVQTPAFVPPHQPQQAPAQQFQPQQVPAQPQFQAPAPVQTVDQALQSQMAGAVPPPQPSGVDVMNQLLK